MLFKVLFIYILTLKWCTVFCEQATCDYRDLIDFNNNLLNKTYCENNPCVLSECAKNEVWYNRTCTDINKIRDKIDVNITNIQAIYNNDSVKGLINTGKYFWEAYHLVNYKKSNLNECFSVPTNATLLFPTIHFLDDGSILLVPHEIVLDKLNYIVNFEIDAKTGKPWITLKVVLEKEDLVRKYVYCYGMFISSFFLILVLFVYWMLQELRNIMGLVLMAYVGTFATAFIIHGYMESNSVTRGTCKFLSPLRGYTIISSFMWMNIFSFDIWWTFRRTNCRNTINGRREWKRMIWYGTYAWGLPLLLIAFEIFIDSIDMTIYMENFKKPNFEMCSVGSTIWFTVPITTVMIINCTFLALTIYNIWRVKREMARFNSDETNCNNQKKSLALIYLKLSVAMGTNWVFEVVSDYDIPFWLEVIVNTYNSFVGVVIFFVFIFKTNILLKICRKLSLNNQVVVYLEKRASRKGYAKRKPTDDTSTRSTPLEINTAPSGSNNNFIIQQKTR